MTGDATVGWSMRIGPDVYPMPAMGADRPPPPAATLLSTDDMADASLICRRWLRSVSERPETPEAMRREEGPGVPGVPGALTCAGPKPIEGLSGLEASAETDRTADDCE